MRSLADCFLAAVSSKQKPGDEIYSQGTAKKALHHLQMIPQKEPALDVRVRAILMNTFFHPYLVRRVLPFLQKPRPPECNQGFGTTIAEHHTVL